MGAHSSPLRTSRHLLEGQYSRRLPLAFIEHQDYHTDYAVGWPRFNDGIIGQLDSTDSIGYYINDEFSRDGARCNQSGPLNEENIPLPCWEDIPYGNESSIDMVQTSGEINF